MRKYLKGLVVRQIYIAAAGALQYTSRPAVFRVFVPAESVSACRAEAIRLSLGV